MAEDVPEFLRRAFVFNVDWGVFLAQPSWTSKKVEKKIKKEVNKKSKFKRKRDLAKKDFSKKAQRAILLVEMKKLLPLLLSILLAEAAGIIGSVFTFSEIPTWYATLVKPSFSPPNWIFGPVWTTLYCLMGISAFLIWQKRKMGAARTGLMIYAVNLVANTLWSIVFFGMHRPDLGLLVIFVLWSTIAIMIVKFWPINKTASLLLVPYLAWVTFATLLNYAIFSLNT